MHAEIADRKDEIARVCGRFRLSRLEVFDSAAGWTDFDPEASDADFLVEFEPPLLPGISDRRRGRDPHQVPEGGDRIVTKDCLLSQMPSAVSREPLIEEAGE